METDIIVNANQRIENKAGLATRLELEHLFEAPHNCKVCWIILLTLLVLLSIRSCRGVWQVLSGLLFIGRTNTEWATWERYI